MTVHCSQTETSAEAAHAKAPPSKTHGLVDSAKFAKEIYRLDTLFNKLYAANLINGNVLIAKHGAVIYQRCFGFADKAGGLNLCDSSIFQLASVSKVFTATAALILYEQNKLKLEEKVSDILQGFPYKGVTVKQLLSHRSGLPNYTYFCSEYLKHDTTTLYNKNILDLMIMEQPKAYFNPGLRFNYSNTNYALLALIIEQKSGMGYGEFLQQEIFTPLGMKHSTVHPMQASGRFAFTKGYTPSFKLVENDRFDGVVGDKGVYSTPYDLFLFSEALFHNKLLKAETQQLAYTPYSPEKKISNYGFGWRMKNFNTPDKEVFHNGWWHGYRTSFHRRLRDSLTIIVLSNRLNKSVYATGRIMQAIDGPQAGKASEAPDEE